MEPMAKLKTISQSLIMSIKYSDKSNIGCCQWLCMKGQSKEDIIGQSADEENNFTYLMIKKW